MVEKNSQKLRGNSNKKGRGKFQNISINMEKKIVEKIQEKNCKKIQIKKGREKFQNIRKNVGKKITKRKKGRGKYQFIQKLR